LKGLKEYNLISNQTNKHILKEKMNTTNNNSASFNIFDDLLWVKISNIDLELIEKDLTRTLGWSQSKCEDIVTEYKKFIYLCSTNTDKTKSMIPSKDVDEVWHAHILRTEKYVSDCQVAGKQYIHHLPTPSNAPPANPSEFENGTKCLYEKVFGPLPQSWRGILKVAECVNACKCDYDYQGEKLTDCGTCSYCGNCQDDNADWCGSCTGPCDDDKLAEDSCANCTNCQECDFDKLAEDNAKWCGQTPCTEDKLATKNWTSLNLEEIKLRLMRKHGWTEERTNDGVEDYKKFLRKVVETSSNLVEHSEDVEKIWENHLLYTRQYQTDCDAINPAGYIHHVPMVFV
jgi:hypothetical protein